MDQNGARVLTTAPEHRAALSTSPSPNPPIVSYSMMMDFLLKTLQRLLSYYPVILPTFYILFRESATSVKYWQAVQRIPYTKPAQKDGENETAPRQGKKPKDYLKSATGFVMVAIYVGVVLVVPIFLKNAVAKLRIFYLCTLSAPFVFLISLATSTQSHDVVVVRSIEGKPVTIPPKEGGSSSLKRGLSLAFGALVTVGALWFGHPLAALVVYAAFIHVIVCSGLILTEKTGFRKLIYTAAILAAFETLFVLIVTAVLIKTPDGKPADTSDHPSSDEDIIIINWTQLFVNANPSIILLQFFNPLSLAYRFDYANSLPLDFKPEVGKKANIGFRIPRPTCFTIRETFPRPYFITAFVALFLSYVGAAALFEGFSTDISYELANSFPAFFSLFLIPSSMLLVAAMKGQLGKLWKYEEDWAAIPSINEEPEALDVDTTLQKYEGEDEDEKDLVHKSGCDDKVDSFQPEGEHIV